MKLTFFTLAFVLVLSLSGISAQQKTDKPLQKRELKTTEKRQIKSVNTVPAKKQVIHVQQVPVKSKSQELQTGSK